MKKVLIICDLFPPAFGPRMGYLCKYLPENGWQPVVLTEKIDGNLFENLAGLCTVRAMPYYPLRSGLIYSFIRIFLLALDLIFGYKDFKIYREACRLMDSHNFDAIICSTYRNFPLATAVKLSRHYNIPIVADFRDIVEQFPGCEYISRDIPEWMKKIVAKKFRNRILTERNRLLKTVDCVTTVSEWHVEILSRYNRNVHLIYNGYDQEMFYPEKIRNDVFTVTYTGRVHSLSINNPGLLFEAIARLSSEKLISRDDFRVDWYTDANSWRVIEDYAKETGVLEFMSFKGFIPSDKIPQVLNSSSILLILTNESKSSGQKGIMTTKFFEYFAVEKPVLCVYSDGSLLEKMIRKSDAGIAAARVENVCAFLLKNYEIWKTYGSTSVNPNPELTAIFSRSNQARQFAGILSHLHKN